MEKTLKYYMELKYPTQITEIPIEDGGGYMIEIPLLKGCISDGETIIKALENIKDAKREWFIYMLENNLPIPEPVDLNKYSGKFVVRIPKSFIPSQASGLSAAAPQMIRRSLPPSWARISAKTFLLTSIPTLRSAFVSLRPKTTFLVMPFFSTSFIILLSTCNLII